ncbi:hypothetical protein OROGR_004492 [Orobanche gracilis]
MQTKFWSSHTNTVPMAEHYQQHPEDVTRGYLPKKGPSTSQVLAVVTLVPIGGLLLTIAGLTLFGALIGLTLSAPIFVIFSPIIVPAVLTIALAVAGFITSGVFGITALSSVSWLLNYLRRIRGGLPQQLQHVGRRVQDSAEHMGQRTVESRQKTQDLIRP